MHLLEIAATQPAFGNHLGVVRAQTSIYGKALSRPSFYGNDDRITRLSSWKLFGITRDLTFKLGGRHERPSGSLLIKAVATLEPKRLVKKNDNARSGLKNLQLDMDKLSPAVQSGLPNGDSDALEEKERLRRMRISKANKGNTPWNKGRKHSPETRQRIRERTKLAMQDPKVKMKLVNLGHSQSEETRIKIGVGVRMGWEKRRKKLLLQETCYFDWQNLIAEASRKGYDGEAEMQWDSYDVLNEQLTAEWLESIEKRKSMPRPKGSKRAPKSPEQRRKISEAISRKWADSSYRERVVSALAKYHGIEPGTERKTRRRQSESSESPRRNPVKKNLSNENRSSMSEMKFPAPRPKVRRRSAPSYKDPLASSKLEMLKNIRAQRATADTKKIEAIERARLLIAEAEKAAKALEVAATKSPVARASLLETRKLIAEAVRSIESIEMEPIFPNEEDEDPPSGDKSDCQIEKEADELSKVPTDPNPTKVNGTRTFAASNKEEDLGFSKLNVQDILNNTNGIPETSSTGHGLSPLSYERLLMQSNSTNGKLEPKKDLEQQREQPVVNGAAKVETPGEKVAAVEAPAKSATVTKKWVRGRLVVVATGTA